MPTHTHVYGDSGKKSKKKLFIFVLLLLFIHVLVLCGFSFDESFINDVRNIKSCTKHLLLVVCYGRFNFINKASVLNNYHNSFLSFAYGCRA